MKHEFKIRFADQAKDSDFFTANLLNNYEDRTRLGIWGTPLATDIKQGFWESTFIGELDGVPIGFIEVASHNSMSCARIEELFILPEHRGKGYGGKLLRFAITFIKNNWDVRLIDCLTIENVPMEALLNKARFVYGGSYDKMYYRNKQWYMQSRWLKEL